MDRSIIFYDGSTKILDTKDYGVHINDYDIPSAEPRTIYQEIEGRSGSLDLSETYGLQYGDVEFSTEIIFIDYDYKKFDEFKRKIHGKRLKVFLPHDNGYYYDARVTVGNATAMEYNGPKGKPCRTCTINYHAGPYKLKKELSTWSFLSGTATKIFSNGAMPTLPTFICSGTCTVTLGSSTVQMSTGTKQYAELVFLPGDNPMTVTVNTQSSLRISYQEGEL